MAAPSPDCFTGRDGRKVPVAPVRGKNGSAFSWSAPMPSQAAVEEMERLFPEIIQLPTTLIDRETEDWTASGVIARPLSRWVPPESVIREFRRAGLAGRIEAIQLAHRILLLKFEQPEARCSALSMPWTVNGQALAMEPWHADFVPADDAVAAAMVWIRLPNLPIEYWNEETLRSILSTAGSFVETDSFTKQRKRGNYARASVRVDLRQSLRPGARLRSHGSPFWQPFVYEQIDCICSRCAGVHLSGSCSSSTAPGTSASGPSFGPWMTALRLRKTPPETAFPPIGAPGVSLPPSAAKGVPNGSLRAEKSADMGGWVKPGKPSRRKSMPSTSQANVVIINSAALGDDGAGGTSSVAQEDQRPCRFPVTVPVTVPTAPPQPTDPKKLDGDLIPSKQENQLARGRRMSKKAAAPGSSQQQSESIFLFGAVAKDSSELPPPEPILNNALMNLSSQSAEGSSKGSNPFRAVGSSCGDISLKIGRDANPASLKRARPSENVGPRVPPKVSKGKIRGSTSRKNPPVAQYPAVVTGPIMSSDSSIIQGMDLATDPMAQGCIDGIIMEPTKQLPFSAREEPLMPDQEAEMQCPGPE